MKIKVIILLTLATIVISARSIYSDNNTRYQEQTTNSMNIPYGIWIGFEERGYFYYRLELRSNNEGKLGFCEIRHPLFAWNINNTQLEKNNYLSLSLTPLFTNNPPIKVYCKVIQLWANIALELRAPPPGDLLSTNIDIFRKVIMRKQDDLDYLDSKLRLYFTNRVDTTGFQK